MSDYNKSTNFTVKDTLPSGNSQKIVKGTELDIEFTNISAAIASKANSDSPTFTGVPNVPTALAGSNTAQIANTAFVKAALAPLAFPSGGIIIWSGSIASIPSGWYLCNGSNGTPDLRDKFIIGASTDDSGVAKTNITGSFTQTGGSKDSVVVSHTHTATSTSSVTDPGHVHGPLSGSGFFGAGSIGGTGPNSNAAFNLTTGSAVTGISVSTSTTNASTGVSGTNQNLPPYYAVAFIMKA